MNDTVDTATVPALNFFHAVNRFLESQDYFCLSHADWMAVTALLGKGLPLKAARKELAKRAYRLKFAGIEKPNPDLDGPFTRFVEQECYKVLREYLPLEVAGEIIDWYVLDECVFD